MVDISSFIQENLIVIIIIVISIALALIILITEIIFKRKERISQQDSEEREKILNYIKSIKKIKSDKKIAGKEKLNKLSIIAKNFFQQYFSFPSNLSYSELIEKFEKIKKPEYILFCREMIDEYYEEEKISEQKVEQIADLLAKTIIERKIPEKSEEQNNKGIESRYMREFMKHNSEVHKTLKNFYKDKNLMKLSKKQITEKDMAELLKNQEIGELRKLSAQLKKARSYFTLIFNSAYEKANNNEKFLLQKLAEEWKKEREKIFSVIKNPIKQHMLEVYLLDKYHKLFKNTQK